jgi:hypothetical protein
VLDGDGVQDIDVNSAGLAPAEFPHPWRLPSGTMNMIAVL